MKKISFYALSISYDNYLLRDGGLPKYIEEQKEAFSSLEIGYVHIAPIRKFLFMDKKYILHDLYTVVINGNYRGIFTEKQTADLLQAKQKEGENLIGIFIHHCIKVNMSFLDFLLRWIPDVPVFFYIHDYYSVCPNFLMLKNDTFFCGKEKRSEEKCKECSCYRSGMKESSIMSNFLDKYCNRIIPVSPSDTAKKIWLNTYRQYNGKIKVVPHLVWNDFYRENMHFSTEKIRIAYVGAALAHKGWSTWTDLYEIFGKNNDSYELFTFGQNTPKCINTTQVNVSITLKESESMQANLRKFQIDCVLLWSNWPETYSYTFFESYAANTFILTCENSGNIADMVNQAGNGLVLKDEGELREVLMNPRELRVKINDFYHSRIYGPLRLEKNCEIEKLLEKKTYRFVNFNKEERELYDGKIKRMAAGILYWIKYRKYFARCKFTDCGNSGESI